MSDNNIPNWVKALFFPMCFINDIFNHFQRYAIFVGKCLLAKFVWNPIFSDSSYVVPRKFFTSSVIFSTRISFLFVSIIRIFFRCAKPKVRRFNANCIITFMTNTKSFWDRFFVLHNPRSSVSGNKCSLVRKFSISSLGYIAYPIPTDFCFFNLTPESFFEFFGFYYGRMKVHGKYLSCGIPRTINVVAGIL